MKTLGSQRCSSQSALGVLTFLSPAITLTYAAGSSTSSCSDYIIGSVFGTLAGLILIVCIFGFIINRWRTRKGDERPNIIEGAKNDNYQSEDVDKTQDNLPDGNAPSNICSENSSPGMFQSDGDGVSTHNVTMETTFGSASETEENTTPSQIETREQIVTKKANKSLGFSIAVAGLYVTSVDDDSTDCVGDVEPGDEIVSIDGVAVEGMTEMEAYALIARAGQSIKFEINKGTFSQKVKKVGGRRVGIGINRKTKTKNVPATVEDNQDDMKACRGTHIHEKSVQAYVQTKSTAAQTENCLWNENNDINTDAKQRGDNQQSLETRSALENEIFSQVELQVNRVEKEFGTEENNNCFSTVPSQIEEKIIDGNVTTDQKNASEPTVITQEDPSSMASNSSTIYFSDIEQCKLQLKSEQIPNDSDKVYKAVLDVSQKFDPSLTDISTKDNKTEAPTFSSECTVSSLNGFQGKESEGRSIEEPFFTTTHLKFLSEGSALSGIDKKNCGKDYARSRSAGSDSLLTNCCTKPVNSKDYKSSSYDSSHRVRVEVPEYFGHVLHYNSSPSSVTDVSRLGPSEIILTTKRTSMPDLDILGIRDNMGYTEAKHKSQVESRPLNGDRDSFVGSGEGGYDSTLDRSLPEDIMTQCHSHPGKPHFGLNKPTVSGVTDVRTRSVPLISREKVHLVTDHAQLPKSGSQTATRVPISNTPFSTPSDDYSYQYGPDLLGYVPCNAGIFLPNGIRDNSTHFKQNVYRGVSPDISPRNVFTKPISHTKAPPADSFPPSKPGIIMKAAPLYIRDNRKSNLYAREQSLDDEILPSFYATYSKESTEIDQELMRYMTEKYREPRFPTSTTKMPVSIPTTDPPPYTVVATGDMIPNLYGTSTTNHSYPFSASDHVPILNQYDFLKRTEDEVAKTTLNQPDYAGSLPLSSYCNSLTQYAPDQAYHTFHDRTFSLKQRENFFKDSTKNEESPTKLSLKERLLHMRENDKLTTRNNELLSTSAPVFTRARSSDNNQPIYLADVARSSGYPPPYPNEYSSYEGIHLPVVSTQSSQNSSALGLQPNGQIIAPNHNGSHDPPNRGRKRNRPGKSGKLGSREDVRKQPHRTHSLPASQMEKLRPRIMLGGAGEDELATRVLRLRRSKREESFDRRKSIDSGTLRKLAAELQSNPSLSSDLPMLSKLLSASHLPLAVCDTSLHRPKSTDGLYSNF